VTFSGQYYQVKELPATIQTVQKPHPPIYVGGGGKRVLSIAAREADIIGLTARSTARGLDWTSALPDANRAKIAWISEAAGERFSALECSNTIFIAAVTDHPEGAAFFH
jgi:alkanesulfonate monooxygenase SsuD/methylene tetrahydromethanopterin reductase-like flavin-dependent oxidoreductase (luciferase family)